MSIRENLRDAKGYFGPVRLFYNPYFSACFFSVRTVFFFHNKSVETVFRLIFSANLRLITRRKMMRRSRRVQSRIHPSFICLLEGRRHAIIHTPNTSINSSTSPDADARAQPFWSSLAACLSLIARLMPGTQDRKGPCHTQDFLTRTVLRTNCRTPFKSWRLVGASLSTPAKLSGWMGAGVCCELVTY